MELLYMNNSYMCEMEATVTNVDGNFIMLDRTVFYPKSGGQPNDTGTLKRNGEIFNVMNVLKRDGVVHEVDREGLAVGDKITGNIDWERRYKLMRMHTSAHVVSGIINKELGAMITGNQLDLEKTRIDFSIENYDPETLRSFVAKANELIKKDLPISVSYMSREEVESSDIAKLAKGLPPFSVLRVVDIVGFDKQPDGGTHVNSLKEIGKIEFLKAENKGKTNRRMYYKIEP